MWEIEFKSHSKSTTVYVVQTRSSGAAHFTAAALRNAYWIVLSVEEVKE